MALPQLNPIEVVLADLGMMVRRARARTLVPAETLAICERIVANLPATGVDPNDILKARVGLIVRGTEDETLTLDTFNEIANSIRIRLAEHRSEPMTLVPNFAVLPYGVHGRETRGLTVIDGGLCDTPETTLKGA